MSAHRDDGWRDDAWRDRDPDDIRPEGGAGRDGAGRDSAGRDSAGRDAAGRSGRAGRGASPAGSDGLGGELHDQPREPLHQPPNPTDLRNRPPRTPACAAIRELLRDFVDGDLEDDDKCQVEEHVHVCRPCAIELSRAEHELLQLRAAFARMRGGEPRLPSGFASALVERLVVDETSMVSPAVLARARTAAAVRAEAERILAEEAAAEGAGPGDHDVRIGPVGLLLAASALLLLLGLGAFWFEHGIGAPDHIARLVVTQQDGASNGRGGSLSIGVGLGNEQFIKVSSGGAAALDWHDASALTQPAAKLALRGEGLVCMEGGRPLLLQGEVEIITNRPVAVPMADGSELRLGIGQYVVVADAGDMFADALPEDLLASLRAAGTPFAVSVEVVDGQSATIVQSTVGAQLVAVNAGQIGSFQSLGPVRIRASNREPVARGNLGDRQVPEAPEQALASLSGGVFDRLGAPMGGSAVFMSFSSAGAMHFGAGLVGADGRFRLKLGAPCASDFAIVAAQPGLGRSDFGLLMPTAMQLVRTGNESSFARLVMLERAVPLTGVVLDDLQQPKAGVEVVPCIVDELFGLASVVLPGVRTTTNASGWFELRGLPTSLPAHQGLVLLLDGAFLEPLAVPVPVRSGDEAAEPTGPFVMRRVSSATVRGLQPNATVTIWEELLGMPPGAAVREVIGHTNEAGEASTLPIRGSDAVSRLWLKVPQFGTVRRLEFDVAAQRWQPGGEADTQIGMVFGPVEGIVGTSLRITSIHRHQQFAVDAGSNVASERALLAHADGQPIAGAQVFAVDVPSPGAHASSLGRANLRFLGFTSPVGAASLEPVRNGGEICIITDDGRVGWLPNPRVGPTGVAVGVSSSGSVLLHPSLRPQPQDLNRVVTVRLERLASPLTGVSPVLHRFAVEAHGWLVDQIPPGEYRVSVGNTSRNLMVPAGGFVELTP